jgi:protein TonB
MTSFQNNITTYRPSGTAPQRAIGFLFATALNAGIAYILLATLGVVPMPTIPMPFEYRVIIEPDKIEIPPPPQPTIPPPRIKEFVPPIIEIPLQPEANPNAITAPEAAPQVAPAEPQREASVERPVPPPIVVTPARAIMATHTIPDYPPVSRRLAEQGTLRLRLTIGIDGTVEDARVEVSSGHERLDNAAVQWVKAHWRYEPAMQGPKAISSAATAEVTFRLK